MSEEKSGLSKLAGMLATFNSSGIFNNAMLSQIAKEEVNRSFKASWGNDSEDELVEKIENVDNQESRINLAQKLLSIADMLTNGEIECRIGKVTNENKELLIYNMGNHELKVKFIDGELIEITIEKIPEKKTLVGITANAREVVFDEGSALEKLSAGELASLLEDSSLEEDYDGQIIKDKLKELEKNL